MGDSQKRSVWRVTESFGAAGVLAVWAVFLLNSCQNAVNPSARCCPALLCVTALERRFSRSHCSVRGDYRRGACRSVLFIQVHASIPHCLSSSLSVEAFFYFLQKSWWRLALLSSRVSWNGRRRLPLHFSVNVHHCNSRLIVFCKNKCEKVESKQIWTSAFVYKMNVPFIYLVGWMKMKSDGAWKKRKLSNIRSGGGMKANTTTERGGQI